MRNGASSHITMKTGCARSCTRSVDLGGAAIDVTVEHSIYGQITAPLHIFSRYDADAFCDKLEHSKARPLCDLTGGIHLHTVRAPDERTLDRVIAGLKEKGFLLEEEN